MTGRRSAWVVSVVVAVLFVGWYWADVEFGGVNKIDALAANERGLDAIPLFPGGAAPSRGLIQVRRENEGAVVAGPIASYQTVRLYHLARPTDCAAVLAYYIRVLSPAGWKRVDNSSTGCRTRFHRDDAALNLSLLGQDNSRDRLGLSYEGSRYGS